jgi:antirestriction protein ArdC
MLLKDTSKTKNNQELVKASIDALVKSLEAGHSDVLSSYLTAMAQFHNYSFQNILLIASQRPRATKVAGIRAWNELGRRVRRGEKGIMIFAPLIGYKRNANEPDAKTGKPEPRLVGFRSVYVFDVEQTEGEELPELGNTVTGEVYRSPGNQAGIFGRDCTRKGHVLRRFDSHSARVGRIGNLRNSYP